MIRLQTDKQPIIGALVWSNWCIVVSYPPSAIVIDNAHQHPITKQAVSQNAFFKDHQIKSSSKSAINQAPFTKRFQ